MSRVEGKSDHFKTTSTNHQQSTSPPLSQLHSNTINFNQQHSALHQHSHRTNNPNLTLNDNLISQRNNSKLSFNHFIQSSNRQSTSTRHIQQQQQQHFLNRPQFPTHPPLQIPNQFNPLDYSAKLSYIPNGHHVSYHQVSNSIHSLRGLPVLDLPNLNPIQSSFESPHSSPSSTNTSYPITSILNSPRTSLSKIANQDSNYLHRSISQDQPERIVTGILKSSLPSQQRSDHQSISQTRPQSMTFTELSARHREAISKFQQKPFKIKEQSTQSNSSSLNKTFSSPTTSLTNSLNSSNLINSTNLSINQSNVIKKDTKKRKSNEINQRFLPIKSNQIPINSSNHQSNLSPFLKSLKQIKSGKSSSEMNLFNQEEKNLLNVLPPLPPNSNLNLMNEKLKPFKKKSVKIQSQIKFKDRFSWFDY